MTIQEVIAKAKEQGKELTEEEAKKLVEEFEGKELTDDDLDKIAGGKVVAEIM